MQTSRKIRDKVLREYTRGVGTPAYMSPELLQGTAYNKSADVYRFSLLTSCKSLIPIPSFGVLMYEVLTQIEPYKEFDRPWKLSEFVIQGNRPRLPPAPVCPKEIADLITVCWAAKPDDRPQFSKVTASLEVVMNKLVYITFPP